jgi:regulator of protease activity HflC (stomatin/prohibitin superfamily)
MKRRIIRVLALAAGAWLVLYQGVFRWTLCRIWVGPDQLLVVVSKTGEPMPPGQVLARAGQKGIQADVLGPGRHFLNPLTHSWEYRPVVEVDAGGPFEVSAGRLEMKVAPRVGVVTALVGDPPSPGQVLAGPGQRGIRRDVLTPGVYRLNPYAYRVELHPATVIPPGSVGVITHLLGPNTQGELAAETEKGVLARVLAPGIHFVNPHEYRVTPVKVGYEELTFEEDGAISFPASDSNMVKVDATVVFGLNPSDAPYVVKRFGDDLVDRVLRPQAESVVRLAGSNFTARQLIEGDTRESFQRAVQDNLTRALLEKHVRVLLVLIRHVEVPSAVREPIQKQRIAEERTLTYRVQTETAGVERRLVEAQAGVSFAEQQAQAATARLVAEEDARGKAAAAEARAETEVEVATIEQEVAALKNEILAVFSAAQSDVQAAKAEVDAAALARTVAAFGGPDAYQRWRFAERLSDALSIELRHRGDGTLWTDAKVAASVLLPHHADSKP